MPGKFSGRPLFNSIRSRRAYKEDNYYAAGLSQSEVNDIILDERLREFAAENQSMVGSYRFGKVYDMVPALQGREGNKIYCYGRLMPHR